MLTGNELGVTARTTGDFHRAASTFERTAAIVARVHGNEDRTTLQIRRRHAAVRLDVEMANLKVVLEVIDGV
jgi:hypothetical protein